MNNIFPLDQENVWNAYCSGAPPNVTLQSATGMPSNMNMGNQLNPIPIPNRDSLGNQMFQAQLYAPETSPVQTPTVPQRDLTPRHNRSRYDKEQVFDFSVPQHTGQSMANGKGWTNTINFGQMKNPMNIQSPDMSPVSSNSYMGIPVNNMIDDYGKPLIDSLMIDSGNGQMMPARYPDVGKYDMIVKQQQQSQLRQQLQQFSQQPQQIQQHPQYPQTLDKQISMTGNAPQYQPQQHQKPPPEYEQVQFQQQRLRQAQKQQQQQQQQQLKQQQQQQQNKPQLQNDRTTNKRQQLQKDRHQKSNIKSVFTEIADNDSKKRSQEKDPRYDNTLNALKQAGLLDITMQTGDLLKKNNSLQKDIDMLEEIVKVTKHMMTSDET